MSAWKKTAWFIAAVMGAYLAVLGTAYMRQRTFIYMPPPPSALPFNVSIPRPDGSMGGWIVAPRQANNQDALVVFGGNAMALDGGVRDVLSACTDRALVLVPYRGYQGNPGIPSEAALIDDGIATVQWAGRNFDHVAVLGIGLGSGVALGVATSPDVQIDRLALATPFDRLDLVVADRAPWALPGLLLEDRFDNLSRVKRVKVPLFAMRAAFDKVVLPNRSRALQAQGVGQWQTLPGGHDSVWNTPVACQWLRLATSSEADRQEHRAALERR